ncbi:MAG: hypothetical protein VB139_02165 [Coriobacteriia bacterium]|nr:hypothetical protein [Coriobacteriia bacterium]
MSVPSGIAGEAERLEALYRAKARAEIDAAEAIAGTSQPVRCAGDELADVVLVKGEPGAADLTAGIALAGEDGVAAHKALDAIGAPERRFAICTRLPGVADNVRLERLALVLEAVDPRIVIALDPTAAHDVAQACTIEPLTPGHLGSWRGRSLLAVDGLEASLSDDVLKRRVWTQFKALAALTDAETRNGRP